MTMDFQAVTVLLGRKFTARTDHSNLQWLGKTPDDDVDDVDDSKNYVRLLLQLETAEPMRQMDRWLAYIEQFDFEIQHQRRWVVTCPGT